MSSTAAQDEFNELFRDKNRISRHPQESDSESESEEEGQPEQFYEIDDNGDDDDAEDYNPAPDMSARYVVPTQSYDANTGPKGVIADAQAYEQAKRSQRRSLFGKREDKPMGYSAAVTANSEKKSDEDSEESFMQRWRQNRLKELQKAGKRARQGTSSHAKRTYGSLAKVDAEGYLEAIDRSPPDTIVVVLIYDDMSDISIMVEDCLRELAKKHLTTRFVKFHCEEAEMNPAGVPAILAYKGGDKFAGLVPVLDELPDDVELSPVSLEKVLKRYQILF